MKALRYITPALLLTSMFWVSCGNGDSAENNMADSANTSKPIIGLAEVTGSPEFPDAALSLKNVTATEQGTDSVKLSFNFDVKNYELKSQTADADGKQCNNSQQGQHIHFILDNKPYAALYEPKHEVTVAKNSEHHLMAFLSRSYHESIKSAGAALVHHFKVDEKGNIVKADDTKTPMIFYSRPKGDYIGKDTENLLFDFYVWNANLSDAGYKVKAEIKGDNLDTTITITSWKPWFLKNMPMGKASIKLTLVDEQGNKPEGPETEVTREFNLSANEPMVAQ